MRNLSYPAIIIALLVALTISACKQDKTDHSGGDTNTSQSVSQGESGSGQKPEDGAQSVVKPFQIGGKRWWDNRKVYFIDMVGGTEDIVFDAIKGQRYFEDTRVFVYCTDEAMKGTVQYNKTEMTLAETEIPDRIFIWVHLDNDRKVLNLKSLISENIKDKLAGAPLVIE